MLVLQWAFSYLKHTYVISLLSGSALLTGHAFGVTPWAQIWQVIASDMKKCDLFIKEIGWERSHAVTIYLFSSSRALLQDCVFFCV